MKAARILKSAALLCNLIDLYPITHNATYWSGKLHMLWRFTLISYDLIEVQNTSEGELAIGNSTALLSKTNRFVRMFSKIDVVKEALREREHFLAECGDDIDVFLDAVADQRQQIDSPLYQCELGRNYT